MLESFSFGVRPDSYRVGMYFHVSCFNSLFNE